MINSEFYRGFTIIVDVQNGGWIIQKMSDECVQVFCSQPTTDAARKWIDQHLASET